MSGSVVFKFSGDCAISSTRYRNLTFRGFRKRLRADKWICLSVIVRLFLEGGKFAEIVSYNCRTSPRATPHVHFHKAIKNSNKQLKTNKNNSLSNY